MEGKFREPRRASPAVIKSLRDAGVKLCTRYGVYYKAELDRYDSRSPEWRQFLEALIASPLGSSSVNLRVYRLSGPRLPGCPNIVGNAREELFQYIWKLPLVFGPDNDHQVSQKLGCYARASDAIPAIIAALRRPAPVDCPLLSQLTEGAGVATLYISYPNLMIRVAIYRE